MRNKQHTRSTSDSHRSASFPSDLDREGFAVLNEFLRPDEISEIQQLVEWLLCSPSEPTCRRPHNALFPLRWNDPIVALLLNSARRLQSIRAVSDATDLRWISGYVSIKQAHSPALWWHQDWWCWDHERSYLRPAPQIAVLSYLSDMGIENGALRVLPTSHHQSTPVHAMLPDAHSSPPEHLDPRDPAMNNLAGQVTLSLKAGDAVVTDYRLLHGTHPNHSGFRRECIILNFTPSWRQLPDDIQGHLVQHTAPAVRERDRDVIAG